MRILPFKGVISFIAPRATSVTCEQAAKGGDRGALHVGQDMTVAIQRHHDAAMPQHLRDDFRINTRAQQQRGAGVAKIMRANVGQASHRASPAVMARDMLMAQRPADLVRGHQPLEADEPPAWTGPTPTSDVTYAAPARRRSSRSLAALTLGRRPLVWNDKARATRALGRALETRAAERQTKKLGG